MRLSDEITTISHANIDGPLIIEGVPLTGSLAHRLRLAWQLLCGRELTGMRQVNVFACYFSQTRELK